MSHSILITGGSGYLGGDLLAHLQRTTLPPHKTLYALARSPEQAEAIKKYGVTPLELDIGDQERMTKTVIDLSISVIFFLVDAYNATLQVPMIKALSEVKKLTGRDVHFLHTSGAKVFSSLVGMPTDRPILDTDLDVYDLQKTTKGGYNIITETVRTNNTVIETAEAHGVRSYIFAPCIVYGESEGFKNRISIQTVAIVKAAQQVGAVYDPNPQVHTTWPVCHVYDNSTMYVQILHSILADENPGFGKNGYYLASPGSIAWNDIYKAMAKALAKRNVIASAEVERADDAAMEKLAHAFGGSKDMAIVQIGGVCTYTAARAAKLGWKPKYAPEHIFEDADAEVERILRELKTRNK